MFSPYFIAGLPPSTQDEMLAIATLLKTRCEANQVRTPRAHARTATWGPWIGGKKPMQPMHACMQVECIELGIMLTRWRDGLGSSMWQGSGEAAALLCSAPAPHLHLQLQPWHV